MKPPISDSIPAISGSSRTELIERCIDAAKASESIFTTLYPESAREAARHADALRSAGVTRPALAGLPVSIKDLFDVAGETTLAGSIALRGHPPAQTDAPAVQRLRAAGAAVLGKTTMTEFAFSGVGLNPHVGTPVNPADPATPRIPGGSSSGAAVSVAAGICVAGIGSDTGGSLRIPAALCGLVGFKPTARRVPTAGTIPLSTTLDTVGAMTRSVDDCILLDRILADEVLSIPDLPLSGLRIGVPLTLVQDGMDAHVAASFAAALTRLSEGGATVIDAPFGLLAESAKINRFAPVEAWAWHRTLLNEKEGGYDSRVAKRIRLGAAYSAADYIDMLAARRDWIARMEQEMERFDVLVMPTVPIVAPPIAALEASEDAFFAANGLLLRNPSAINLLDGCAISLPCHAPGSLPVGMMIAGPALSDAKVLAAARAIYAALA